MRNKLVMSTTYTSLFEICIRYISFLKTHRVEVKYKEDYSFHTSLNERSANSWRHCFVTVLSLKPNLKGAECELGLAVLALQLARLPHPLVLHELDCLAQLQPLARLGVQQLPEHLLCSAGQQLEALRNLTRISLTRHCCKWTRMKNHERCITIMRRNFIFLLQF